MAIPRTTAQWTIAPKDGLDGLKLEPSVPIPPLGPKDCLVKINAVSLNYRDVALPTGSYPLPGRDKLVPTSDAAGEVIAVGDEVALYQIGDRVCSVFTRAHQSGLYKSSMGSTMLGTSLDGPLREFAVFPETALVSAPKTLDPVEASTLPCAGVTAWNALFGLSDRAVQAGDVVLVQGTGGVSLFALRFALAAGATVIATTSSERKEQMLKKLGAHHVINYKTDANWGSTARSLAGGEGVSHVIEVGGQATVSQSLAAIKPEGVVAVIGFLTGTQDSTKSAGFAEFFKAAAIVRIIEVSRCSLEQSVPIFESVVHGC
jgi:NADPH:quinone reductase-like Zn-dependent oxidoreductase